MTFNTRQPLIQFLAPDVFEGRGGIQIFSSFMLKAALDILPDAIYDIHVKNDVRNNFVVNPNQKYSFAGHVPGQLRQYYFAAQIVKEALIHRPELIITTHPHFSVVGRYLKLAFGIPYWIVAHGIDVWGTTNSQLKRALCEADLVLPVSHYTRDRLLSEQDLDPENVVILPNTFDAKAYNVKPKPHHLLERYAINSYDPVILTVSRLNSKEKYKGYDTIIRAMPIVRQAIPNIRYIIVGKGDDRPRIEQMIAELGLENCVTLTGFVPDEELCGYYNLCDIFAMPSKGEGFGIVFLEAMACGKPVLAGNKDGSVDALRHGELGVLIDPDNIGEITSALIGVLNKTYQHPIIYDPQLLRQKVIEAYGFESFKSNLAGLLQTRSNLHLNNGIPINTVG